MNTVATTAPTKTRTKNKPNELFVRSSIQLIAVLVFFGVWQLGVSLGWISAFMVGSPVDIAHVMVKGVISGDLLTDTGYTLIEAMLGFVIGTVMGSAIGLGLWYSPFLARITEPFLIAINSVPKIAFGPIVILWFGTGLVSKVALAVSLTAIVALIAAYQAAKNADQDLHALLITLGASKTQVFKNLVVPSSLPAIIATFHINIGFGLVGAVVGEFISSEHGLGHMIFTASGLYDLNSVWAGLFTLMIVGFILYFVIEAIESRLLPWKEPMAGNSLRV
ncbi:ABC transporter permease [Pseudomonas extremaustralis]|jgi:NitT/TauT family transport system permease protein|uniref:ABC transporter permease n=1 Tax=Pseudomonas extremaustralis TaxID=359110 RepID=UPI0023DFEE9A|nr:ABC transporter permease [Pseudomonas extremaustralis]MDF3133552.1 ABC transporter permease [Pseudomonas extremaustralis]